MRAVQVSEYGSADVLEMIEVETPEPGVGELRIDVASIGVNFADIKRRKGISRSSHDPPFTPGIEAAGTVEAVGSDIEYEPGDRVVAYLRKGAYADAVVVDARSVFPIPSALSFDETAGALVQFVTAYSCLHHCGQLEAGDRVLVHGAAGGVGSSAVQLAAGGGAEVYATASATEKLEFAAKLGADHLINYVESDFGAEIERLTDGEGVDIVLDGVGGTTSERSVDALSTFGRLVSIGCVSGEEGCPDLSIIRKSHASILGYHLGVTVEQRPDRVRSAVSAVFSGLADGDLELSIDRRVPLRDARRAHEHLESRNSKGKLLLHP